ncbi:ribonuclease HII [Chryseomicrobium palamuruense]|uniref:Ribonuclease HII n=1 Tax=Chryseomicrobium palamuruense TaxID=682973 RepID=A0ABV8UV39_9BACL
MESVKVIQEKLKTLESENEWFTTLRTDQRLGVQKLIKSWDSRQQKKIKAWEEYLDRVNFDLSFGEGIIAGVDEAGRGPLAGPVVTAAVILPADTTVFIDVNDSKQLSREKRQRLAEIIRTHALSYFIHIQPAGEIDRLNIYEATKQSMKKAVESLEIKPDYVLADAMQIPVDMPCHSIIKGDAKSLSIAAASILAKTTRDEYMNGLHKSYRDYGFDQHAGYGTPQHLEAIASVGICPEHRHSFEPIKSLDKKR